MEIVLVILAILCFLVGLAGCILPVIPGPPISYFGLLLIHWAGFGGFSTNFLLIWGAVVLIVTLLDFYLPVVMTNRFGGSRAATIGSAVGLVAGLFLFPPVGLIVCPFLGAFIGQLIYDREDTTKALRVALGSFAAFVIGTGAKFVISGVMLFYGVAALFMDK